MLAEVGQLLDAIAGASVSLQAANGAGRHFELLIIAEIASELNQRGYSIDLISSDGTRQSTTSGPIVYRQRGGVPSPVPPASWGSTGPTSILFRSKKSEQEWEIWNGVEFDGRSGGRHEFDIAIVPKALADDVRSTGGAPLGHGWVLIECKHRKDAASPDEARTLIARIYDTTLLRSHVPYLRPSQKAARIFPPTTFSPGYGPGAITYRERNKAGYTALVRTTGFSLGAIALTAGYFIAQHENIALGSAELAGFRKDVANWIDANL